MAVVEEGFEYDFKYRGMKVRTFRCVPCKCGGYVSRTWGTLGTAKTFSFPSKDEAMARIIELIDFMDDES